MKQGIRIIIQKSRLDPTITCFCGLLTEIAVAIQCFKKQIVTCGGVSTRKRIIYHPIAPLIRATEDTEGTFLFSNRETAIGKKPQALQP